MSGKKQFPIVRSSAAEYLTSIAASGKGGVEAVYADENIWLTQKMMGVLYDIETHTINYHLKKIFADSELHKDPVIRKFRITAADRDILQDAEKVTAEFAKAHAESEFEKYRVIQDRLYENDFDRMINQVGSGNGNPEGDGHGEA